MGQSLQMRSQGLGYHGLGVVDRPIPREGQYCISPDLRLIMPLQGHAGIGWGWGHGQVLDWEVQQ